MIYLYYGKIGDGKTYHVVANEIIPALRAGRKVYTNIDGLSLKHLSMLTGRLPGELHIEILSNDNLKQLLNLERDDKEGHSLLVERGSLIVVDEAQMLWDAREFRDTSKSFLTFLEYHRHFGLDLVFITQNVKRLETSISRLANESYQVKNLRFLGRFLSSQYVVHIRQTPHDRERIATIRGTYRPEVFTAFRSYVARGISHGRPSKTALKGFVFYTTGILLVLGIAMFAIRGGFSFFEVDSQTQTQTGFVYSAYTDRGNNDGNTSVSNSSKSNHIHHTVDTAQNLPVVASSKSTDRAVSKRPLYKRPVNYCEPPLNLQSGTGWMRVDNTLYYLEGHTIGSKVCE